MKTDKVDINWDDEKKNGITDNVKKLLVSGLTSSFMSEDQIKAYLSGLNLPKEVLIQILKGAQKSKDDLMARVSQEFAKVIQKVDIAKEFKKILQENKISINAEIEFTPKQKSDGETKEE